MRDFFSRQDSALTRSRTFYTAFAIAVAGAVLVLYFVVTGCFLAAGLFSPFKGYSTAGWWPTLVQYSLPAFIYGEPREIIALRPMLILLPAITAFILLLSYYKTGLIKKGGSHYVARSMGGIAVRQSRNAEEKRLVNIVEEMALAAGLPKPHIFLLSKEWSINAVTAGLDYEDAMIAVTAGALKHLDRDELQGVIAHEFAHILNGDYSLNLTMAGWLYGLLFFSVQGRDMMGIARDFAESTSAQEKGSLLFLAAAPMFLMGFILWAGGSVGKLAAELTQAAMSRKREEMADAFAVQFTRNPRGLAGALKKIAAFPQHGTIRNGLALMMKSFFIASPLRLRGLFRSHPPLEERILSLEPSWDGSLPDFNADHLWPVVNSGYQHLRPDRGAPRVAKSSPENLLQRATDYLDGNWMGTLVLGLLAGHVGQYDQAGDAVHRSLELADRLYEKMPPELRAAVDDSGLVPALIAAAFVSREASVAERQLEMVAEALGRERAEQAQKFAALMEDSYRLPLLSMASPALGELSEEARQSLAGCVTALVAADGKLDIFEIAALWVLKKRLRIRLVSSGISGGPDEDSQDYLRDIQTSVVVVLSTLARLGGRREDEEQVQAAYQAGQIHFNQWPLFEIFPKEQTTSRALVHALECLQKAPQTVKNTLVVGAVAAVLHDNFISLQEYELLRALAAALDIPLPYFSA